ncbi:dimethylaniline monooxygenase [Sodiomyces alkalinus F11]|uniref:Dimethylaniline monooxygenase n=1 Tax=Sodiomyces alkalinus (strain CBS 110278 / VKM F-3762 / F11) TaxID=1314773 RepID=A0A3N2Q8E3_SODAK|nr:dimethylaniline monooxygenase [Sodiomyces alkalinus F11]ROT43043.1 dimethylaniline monooxygenase [Sodiomyces alkalinus F11]
MNQREMFWRSSRSASWVPISFNPRAFDWQASEMGRPLLPQGVQPATVKVAVIGAAGPAGLSSLKELREVGFDVTVYERRSDVGGIFTVSGDPTVTSATDWTRSQLSKYISPMSDFPFPDETSLYVSSREWSEYYRQYARHFKLYVHIRFDMVVKVITRDHDNAKWLVYLEGQTDPEPFDKVVFASGSEAKAIRPVIEGLDVFEGQFLHGQAYKSPVDFKDENVVVLGMGNSAADTASELTGHASNVYLSHRRGARIVPRSNEDGPMDTFFSWKKLRLGFWAEHYVPGLFQLIVDGLIQRRAIQSRDAEISDRSIEGDGGHLICSDHLVPLVQQGKIQSVRGIRRFTGPRSLELDDGSVLEEIDAVIACTGYRPDFSLLPDLTFTQLGDDLPPFPDLFQNIFPPAYGDSLACLNYGIVTESAAPFRELQAMAVAQVWAGRSPLPPREAMERQVDDYQQWLGWRMRVLTGTYFGKGRMYPWMKFLHRTAGTGMYEHMSWGWRGWWFWLRERRVCGMMGWGVYSPHMYRLFETGKRSAWPGARDAIIRVNEERERAFPRNKKHDKKQAKNKV